MFVFVFVLVVVADNGFVQNKARSSSSRQFCCKIYDANISSFKLSRVVHIEDEYSQNL